MRFPLPGARRRWALGGAGMLVLLIGVVAILARWPFAGELSRAEFIAQGDGICAQAGDAFEELQKVPPRTAPQAADLTARLVDIAADELDEIAGLNPPSELDGDVDRYLAAREEGIELLREGLDAAEAGEPRRYGAAQSRLAAGQRSRRRLAREIGFRKCSRPLGSP